MAAEDCDNILKLLSTSSKSQPQQVSLKSKGKSPLSSSLKSFVIFLFYSQNSFSKGNQPQF